MSKKFCSYAYVSNYRFYVYHGISDYAYPKEKIIEIGHFRNVSLVIYIIAKTGKNRLPALTCSINLCSTADPRRNREGRESRGGLSKILCGVERAGEIKHSKSTEMHCFQCLCLGVLWFETFCKINELVIIKTNDFVKHYKNYSPLQYSLGILPLARLPPPRD